MCCKTKTHINPTLRQKPPNVELLGGIAFVRNCIRHFYTTYVVTLIADFPLRHEIRNAFKRLANTTVRPPPVVRPSAPDHNMTSRVGDSFCPSGDTSSWPSSNNGGDDYRRKPSSLYRTAGGEAVFTGEGDWLPSSVN